MFVQSLCEYSLFVLNKFKTNIVVLVYVDDLIVAENDCHAIKHFKSYLHACFHMKDLGPLKYFLGVEVAHSSSGIYLCQRKYTLDIIRETGLLGAKPATTPLEQNHHLALADGPIFPILTATVILSVVLFIYVSRDQNFPIVFTCYHNLCSNQKKIIGMQLSVWFDT